MRSDCYQLHKYKLAIVKPFEILRACNFWLWDWNITVKIPTVMAQLLYFSLGLMARISFTSGNPGNSDPKVSVKLLTMWTTEDQNDFYAKNEELFWKLVHWQHFFEMDDLHIDILLFHIHHKVLSEYFISTCFRRIFTSLQSISCGNLIHMRYLQCYLMCHIWYLHICRIRVLIWLLIL